MLFKDRNSGLRVAEVEPDDKLIEGNFEAEGVGSFERKMLINML